MYKLVVLVTTIWSWLWIIQTIMGDYDVSVRLLEYTRDQDCGCDGGLWGCHECDVFFQICLQPLSPTQEQICQRNNQDYRVEDTHHFLFASALRGHDTYTWSNVNGQPTFQIAVHVFDYDFIGDNNDDLGVTSYTYRGTRPTVQTVTTSPGNKNLRIRLTMNVTYSSARSGSTMTSKTNSYRTSTTTPTTTTTYTITTIPYKTINPQQPSPTKPQQPSTKPQQPSTKPQQPSPTTTTTPFSPLTTTIYGKRTNTPTATITPFTTTMYRKTINTPTTTPHTFSKLTTSKVCSETTGGNYDVSVRLLEYNRDQDCGCDGGLWGCGECDVFFQICLQPLSPTQGQICQRNNQDDRVDDTHHFLFADALKGHDTYRWRNLGGQPSFQISVHAFDYDPFGSNDDLGVTSYTYRGNGPPVHTVTTNPGNKNMRLKLLLNVSCSSNNGGLTSSTPPTVHSTLMSTETQNMTRDYTSSMTSTSNCADLHDSCAEFDLVYGICKATPHDSPLLYKQALEECKRTCRFC
eukprot:XP_011428340.1 PREDICTED: uncharacterized protein LOC105328888 [Crassostrea gigas]